MWGLLGTTPAQQRHSRGCTKPPASHSGIKISLDPALQPPQYWVRSPNSATAPYKPSCKARAPALLLAQHPWGQGTQNRVHHASGMALEGGLESIHPTGKVVIADAPMGAEDTGEVRMQELS